MVFISRPNVGFHFGFSDVSKGLQHHLCDRGLEAFDKS